MKLFDLSPFKTVYDRCPQAVSILHVEKDANGKNKIIVVYANQAEADLQGEPLYLMIGGCCNDIFTESDSAWLTYFADVALSGTERSITMFSHKLQKQIFCRCYSIGDGHIVTLSEDVSTAYLKESATQDNSRYRDLFNRVQCGVFEFEVKADGIRYLDANPAGLEMLGYTGKEFWKRSVWQTEDIVMPEDAESASRVFDILSEIGDQTSFTYRLLKKDSSYIWATGRLTLTEKSDDAVTVQSYLVDITDQKRLQDINEESHRKTQTTVDSIPGGVIVYEICGKDIAVLQANPAACEIMGLDEKKAVEARNEEIYSYVHPDDLRTVRNAVSVLKNPGGKITYRYRTYNRFKGRYVWIMASGKTVKHNSGQIIVYLTFHDISDFVESTRKYSEVFYALPGGIIEYVYRDGNVKVSNANPQVLCMFGYDREEIVDDTWRSLSQFFHSDYVEPFGQMLRSLKNAGDVCNADFRLKRKDNGYVWASGTLLLQSVDEEGIHILSAVNNEEARKKAENESVAKTRFLSRMSHELRTPINAIMGIAELANQDVSFGTVEVDRVAEYAKQTMAASEYLLTLVNDILDNSRIENNTLEIKQDEINAAEYLNEISKLTEIFTSDKSVCFSIERKTHLRDSYIGDGIRVKQIVMSLLSNAFKFTPPGGSVELVAEAISETEDTTTLQFTVSDTGIGISEEFQKQMFEPFSQEESSTTSPYSGTGLGLSIAKDLTQLMGGDLVCHSKKGKGSTFIATIKVGNVPEKKRETAQSAEIDKIDFSGVTVLLCEDHPLNQRIAKALLERKHCHVDVADDGAAGLEMFKNSPVGYYSIILMDIRMPNMDGLHTARAVRGLDREDADVPIVAMSANAFEEDVINSLKAGMNDHLAKPVDPLRLFSTIAEYTDCPLIGACDKPLALVLEKNEEDLAAVCEAITNDFSFVHAENGSDALQMLEKYPRIVAVVADVQITDKDSFELIKAVRKNTKYDRIAILVNTRFGDRELERQLLSLGADDFVYKPNDPVVLAARLKNITAKRNHVR